MLGALREDAVDPDDPQGIRTVRGVGYIFVSGK